MITKGFRKRRDYEAKQERSAREEIDESDDLEEQTENPERPMERQSPPDQDETGEDQSLFTRIWRSIRGG